LFNSEKLNVSCCSGKKVQGEHNTRLEYSTNFFAVLHQIKKLDCVSCDIFQLSEVPIQVGAFSFSGQGPFPSISGSDLSL
jgi:hypothetical protein